MQQSRHGSSGTAIVLQGSVDEKGVGLQQGAEGLGVARLDGFEGGLEGWVVHGGGGIKLGQRLGRELLGGR